MKLTMLWLSGHSQARKPATLTTRTLVKCVVRWFLLVCIVSSVSVRAVEGAPYNVSGALVEGGNAAVLSFTPYAISQDERYLVFSADKDQDDVVELYSVALDGGTPVKLNSALVAGGDVHSFYISPNSDRVVYVADQELDEKFELYSVPIQGGTVTKLNRSISSTGDVNPNRVAIDSGGQFVVFAMRSSGTPTGNIHSVPIAGPAPGDTDRILSLRTAGNTGEAASFQITPDGTRVVFSGDLRDEGTVELYSNSIAGGDWRRLSPDNTNTTFESVFSFQISPDSQFVAFTGDLETDSLPELFLVPTNGGSTRKISGDLVAGGQVSNTFQFSPDNTHVVFHANKRVASIYEIFSVDYTAYPFNVTPVTTEQVTQNINPGGQVSSDFKITADGQRVVYSADVTNNDRFQLFSNSMAGDDLTLLFFGMNELNVRPLFDLSPDGQTVVYRADIEPSVYQLYSVPVLGGTSQRINGTFLIPSSDVGLHFLISKDGQHVGYIADQDEEGKQELYLSGIATLNGADNEKVSQTGSPSSSQVLGFQLSDNATFAVFELRSTLLSGDTVSELFATRLKPEDDLCVPIRGLNTRIAVICL